jgi:hypothetical protein
MVYYKGTGAKTYFFVEVSRCRYLDHSIEQTPPLESVQPHYALIYIQHNVGPLCPQLS